ncbi:hypothetical protein BDA99DRAFT_519138 [Phascolomyces articulosus]|uniref:Uncharacterized protein n=1 Tax=Phascolomyces articulosus TaxID=60185 RepID=A0AAD5PB25_9FUNG|nr:hypothetical protein BDA99DRAFT_519138 [Phascolomyces articulosus]
MISFLYFLYIRYTCTSFFLLLKNFFITYIHIDIFYNTLHHSICPEIRVFVCVCGNMCLCYNLKRR